MSCKLLSTLRWNSGAQIPGITREQQKMQLARHHADQKQKLDQDQRQSHEMELRKYKRKRLTGKKSKKILSFFLNK